MNGAGPGLLTGAAATADGACGSGGSGTVFFNGGAGAWHSLLQRLADGLDRALRRGRRLRAALGRYTQGETGDRDEIGPPPLTRGLFDFHFS